MLFGDLAIYQPLDHLAHDHGLGFADLDSVVFPAVDTGHLCRCPAWAILSRMSRSRSDLRSTSSRATAPRIRAVIRHWHYGDRDGPTARNQSQRYLADRRRCIPQVERCSGAVCLRVWPVRRQPHQPEAFSEVHGRQDDPFPSTPTDRYAESTATTCHPRCHALASHAARWLSTASDSPVLSWL